MKRQGDTFMRLVNRDGNLIMDEGDIEMDRPLKAPLYIRKKRIAHARDFQKFLDVSQCTVEYQISNIRYLEKYFSNKTSMST